MTTAWNNVVNKAVGGSTSNDGINQLRAAYSEDVMPDIVSLAFGMNDQNKLGSSTANSVAAYIQNYRNMVNFIKTKWPEAQIIFITQIPASPAWSVTS